MRRGHEMQLSLSEAVRSSQLPQCSGETIAAFEHAQAEVFSLMFRALEDRGRQLLGLVDCKAASSNCCTAAPRALRVGITGTLVGKRTGAVGGRGWGRWWWNGVLVALVTICIQHICCNTGAAHLSHPKSCTHVQETLQPQNRFIMTMSKPREHPIQEVLCTVTADSVMMLHLCSPSSRWPWFHKSS